MYYITLPYKASPAAAVGIIVLRMVQAFSPALYAIVVAQIVDSSYLVIQNKDIFVVVPFLLLLFFLIVFQFLGNTLMGLLYTWLRTGLRKYYDREILGKISRLPYSYIEDKDTYKLIHRIDGKYDEKIIDGFRTYLRTIGNAAQIISILGIILSAGAWQSAALLILFSVPLVLSSITSGKNNYDASVKAAAEEQKAEYLNEVMLGKEAALERNFYGYSHWLRKKWSRQFSFAQNLVIQSQIKMIVHMKLGSILTVIISVAVCAMLIPSLLAERMSFGIFCGLTTAIFNFVILVSWEVSDNFSQLVQCRAYRKDLEVFWSLDEILPVEKSTGRIPPEVSIRFEHVSFRYPGSEEFVLKDLNLELKPHKQYAVVGINGAGKTTLIKLLTGLYTEFEGKIWINHQEIRELSPDNLKNYFSVAFQDFARYNITIREYLQFTLSLEENQIWETLSAFNMKEVIAGFPLGLDTPMGKIKEEGRELSQGQWQRLMLARTLLHAAPVYIFDEPTSAIDPVGESQLYGQIRKMTKEHLSVFITHRLGAARTADEILVLNNGSIAERGSHEELMRNKGFYAEMFETQREWYINE